MNVNPPALFVLACARTPVSTFTTVTSRPSIALVPSGPRTVPEIVPSAWAGRGDGSKTGVPWRQAAMLSSTTTPVTKQISRGRDEWEPLNIIRNTECVFASGTPTYQFRQPGSAVAAPCSSIAPMEVKISPPPVSDSATIRFRRIRFALQLVRAQGLDEISMRGHFLARRYRPDALHAGGGFAAGTDR